MKVRNVVRCCAPSVVDFAFLAPAILLFCLMSGAASLLVDGDTGWHIRAGEWILDHRQFPTTDFFSFTKPGQPWFAWEWLWEVSFAWLYRIAGMPGFVLANVAVLCLMSMNLWHLVRRRSKTSGIAAGVLVLAILAMSMYFFARPQLVSFLFAVLLLRLLDGADEPGRGVPWMVVPLFLVWANVHPAFVGGLIILAAHTAGSLASAWTATEPERRAHLLARFRRLILLTAACVLVALINPYGHRLYLHMLSFLSDSYAYNHINEYKVVDFRTGPGRMFELMLFLGAPAAISRLLKRDFTVPFLFLAWAHLALTAQRNIPFFLIVMAGPVVLWLEEMAAAFSHAPLQQEATDEPRISRVPLLGVLSLVLVFGLLRTPGSPPKFRPEYDPSIYPAHAVEAVRKLGPGARMVTTNIWGGYLVFRLYPDFRVFWDGRADFYGTPYNLAALDTLNGRPGWDKTLARNRINAVLVPLDQPLAALLSQSKDWQVVYRDRLAVLFQLISPYELQS
jgi:hypothetical protein